MKQVALFRKVGGVWQRVDSQSQKPLTLAEFIKQLGIIIDDDCQFCRIIRNNKTITYRAYGGTIEITTTTS